jgi:hypothetical protein
MNGHHGDPLAFDAVVDRIRETTDQGATNFAVDDRVEFRVELDAVERRLDRVEEVSSPSPRPRRSYH